MFEQIRDMLAEQLEFDAEKITPETDILNDLPADSLDLVEFVSDLESEFSIMIPQDELQNLHTVGEVAELVERLSK